MENEHFLAVFYKKRRFFVRLTVKKRIFGRTFITFARCKLLEMEQKFELIAKTFMGLEPVLAKELTQMGANDVEIGRRMVSFTGDKEMMYRANFQLHTAIRILKPIRHFRAKSADDVYEEIKKIDWTEYLGTDKTFTVDSVVFSEEFRHSKFVSYKVKDAIVDQFREKTGKRPNISVANPDIRLNMHIAEDKCTLSLDSSGESLHRRGYRQESVEAPLNEVLAAGMILLSGWQADTDFIDPMCGSGTLLIEAALIAKNMAPGLFRKEFAFEKWPDFDADLFDEIYNDESQEREFNHKIYGYDIDMKAVNTARMNVKAAGLSDIITVEQQDFKNFTQPANKSIMISNPPYGERTSIKIPLYNGSLECEFRKYQMFDGKLKDFRSEGGVVKTEEEKRQMAEKHRFKKEREFKKRLEEKEENEEADILNFTFHKHDLGRNRGGHESFDRSGKDRKERKEFSKGDRKEFGKGKDRKDFKRGGKRDFSKGKDFGKKKRFDDDED